MLGIAKRLGLETGFKVRVKREVAHIGGMVHEVGMISASRLKSAEAEMKSRLNAMINKVVRDTVEAGRVADTGITFVKNTVPFGKRVAVTSIGEKVIMPVDNTHLVENKRRGLYAKIGINPKGGITRGAKQAEMNLDPRLEKYVCDSFEGEGREAQNNFNTYLKENVWCDETLSNADKIQIMKANFDKLTPDQKVNFNVLNEARVIKNPDYSNWGGWPEVEWPEFPGLNKDTAISVYNKETEEILIPSELDRLGSPYGNNLGIVDNGYHCTQDERAICYIENEYARNSYKFDRTYYKDVIDAIKNIDISEPEYSVDEINNIIDKLNTKYKINNPYIEVGDILLWNKDYNAFQKNPKLVELCEEKGVNSTYGVMGAAEQWLANGELITSGGAGQVNIPVKVKALEDIGILRNIGGW